MEVGAYRLINNDSNLGCFWFHLVEDFETLVIHQERLRICVNRFPTSENAMTPELSKYGRLLGNTASEKAGH